MQDLEKFKNEMNLSGKNVYVGNRYAPVYLGDWDNTKEYEPLSIVMNEGDSFVSRGYVPTGVDIHNEEYWHSVGVYNAQVADYKQRVEGVEDLYNTIENQTIENTTNVSHITSAIETSEINVKYPPKPLTGLKGDGETDDTQALKDILSYAISNNIRNIYFPSGEYIITESITINSNFNIYGGGKNVTYIKYDNVNDDTLFNLTDSGNFINISKMALRGNYYYTDTVQPLNSIGINAPGSQHLKLYQLDIRGFGTGVKITRGLTVSAIGVVISECYIRQNLMYGVNATGVHKLNIHDGAIEMNNEWNIFLERECMEVTISGVNMNISNLNRNGSLKTESNSTILDSLQVTHCHFEDNATNKFKRESYLIDINSNNVKLNQNYIKSRDEQVLGGVKSITAQNNFDNNIFRNLTNAFLLTENASNYVTYLRGNIYETVTNEVITVGTLVRYQNLGMYEELYTQDIYFNAAKLGTIAIKKPRNKNMIYRASLSVVRSASSVNQLEGQVVINTNNSSTTPVYSSPENFMKGKNVGTELTTIELPRDMTGNDLIYIITRENTASPNAELLLRIEWM